MRSTALITVASATLVFSGCDEQPDRGGREFVVTVENLSPTQSLFQSGTFDTPEGDESDGEAGPIGPGQRYSFEVVVHRGAALQVATMFYESNDAFLAFAPGGIALWSPTGEILDGDRTAELVLYDAGTELNEPLGFGMHQAPRQSEPGAGEPEHGVVTRIGTHKSALGPDGVWFPAVQEFVRLEIVHIHESRFRVEISNVSPKNLLNDGPGKPKPALLSPGVFTVHGQGFEWFQIGEVAPPDLERLAEDGEPGPAAELFEQREGVVSHLSGAVWAVHEGDLRMYEVGTRASPGLQQHVEDARSQTLLDELGASPAAIVEFGVAWRGDGPVIEPGTAVELRFRAVPGDRLGLVTGYLAANDKLIGLGAEGVALFDARGKPRIGELDDALELLDLGTEVDEPPGLGPNQFERQSSRGGGIDEHGLIERVEGEWMGWRYPPPAKLVRVTIDVE